MNQPQTLTSRAPDSYELLGRRVQRLIADPRVQRLQAVTVTRLEHESASDWRQLLDEISDTAGIHVDELDGGAVRIAWKEYCEA